MPSVILRRELVLVAFGVTLGSAACFSSAEQLTSSSDDGDAASEATGDASASATDETTAQTTEETLGDGSDPTGDPTSHGESTADGSGEAESGDPIACGAGMRCVPASPPSWLGPFAVLPKPPDPNFMCPPDFPELVHEAKAGPTHLEADCTCGPCSGANPTCGISFASYAAPQCAGMPDVEPMGPGCSAIPPTAGEPVAFGYLPNVLDQACATPTAQLPPAVEWEQELIACAGYEPESACGAGGCWPQLPMMKVCIAREGNDVCPAGWPDKVIVAQDADDDRSCPPCQCEVEATCNERVQLITTGDCDTQGESVEMAANTCSDTTAVAVQVAFDPQGGCVTVDPSPEPIGNVQLIDPLTLCCQVI